MQSSALISTCGLYRYWLLRVWNDDARKRYVLWVMLNPSTADASQDDPTIRRCIGYSKAWGYDGLIVCNLYAYRATQPKDLWKATDPVGPENDRHLESGAHCSSKMVAAWGANADPARAAHVREIMKRYGEVCALSLTKDRQPKHPLYLPSILQPQPIESFREMTTQGEEVR